LVEIIANNIQKNKKRDKQRIKSMNPLNLVRFKYWLLPLLALFFAAAITSCEDTNTTNPRWYVPEDKNQQETTAIDSAGLWGHWVCKDFVDLVGARRSVRFVHTRPLFIEIVFSPDYGDSALLITAYEDFFAPWEKNNANDILIKNVMPGKDIVLSPQKGTNSLMLTDTLDKRGTQQIHNWTFEKAAENDIINDGNFSTAIASQINHTIFEGDFLQAQGNGIPITFARNGTISGWPMYNKYKICLGGDCFRLTGPAVDIVKFIGSRDIDYFAFNTNAAADSLFLYKLIDGKPDKSYSYKTEELTYSLGKLR
jgi:hypothetical protein